MSHAFYGSGIQAGLGQAALFHMAPAADAEAFSRQAGCSEGCELG